MLPSGSGLEVLLGRSGNWPAAIQLAKLGMKNVRHHIQNESQHLSAVSQEDCSRSSTDPQAVGDQIPGKRICFSGALFKRVGSC